MTNNRTLEEEVKRLCEEEHPGIVASSSIDKKFFQGRDDICIAKICEKMAMGSARTNIYLIWKDTQGRIKKKRLFYSDSGVHTYELREIYETPEKIILNVVENVGVRYMTPTKWNWGYSKKELGL